MTVVPLPAGALELVACAAHLFGTTPRDILQPAKHRHIARARWAVWWVLRFHGVSYNRIGRRFGKHHTTVIHGNAQAEYLMARCYDYADKVATLVALRDGDFISARRVESCKQRVPMLRRPEQPKDVMTWE